MFWNKKRSAVTVGGGRAIEGNRAGSGALDFPARGKLIFAMDATASRQSTWDSACALQSTMFDVAGAHGGLDVKLVYFRGKSECRASGWTADTLQLRAWMQSVSCDVGTTQIERVLTHALKMRSSGKVNALVFVGDAMEEDESQLFRLARSLGELGVPIFLFQEGVDTAARQAFMQVAKLSKGAYLSFSHASVHRLRELLGAVAVYASGGNAALLAHAKKSGNADALRLTNQVA